MDKQRWTKIEEILDHAVDLKGEERTTYIETACSGDNELIREVHEILKAMERSEKEDFLEAASLEHQDLFRELNDLDTRKEDLIGSKIGPFRISELIGEGGMGSVFKAEREDGTFNQEVAIKIVRSTDGSDELNDRFMQERRILAGLQHPHIASLYDGGVTADGSSYLVMEFVDGLAIDEYCNQHSLGIKDRLKLFKDVCSAVQYAHSNLVIHRDLKAANILVTESGIVKILDFGIAKLTDPELTDEELLQTRPGQKFWTPNYASPEQVNGLPISTSSDIYSLGVLLFKLLSGGYPIDLHGKKYSELTSFINNSQPRKLSDAALEVTDPSFYGCSSPSELSARLKGDIDAIVSKALRKEPERRYASPEQLNEDIERFLNGFPVIAQPDSFGYHASKFLKRNKAVVVSISLLLVVSIIAAVISANLAIKTREAEQLAIQEAEEAKRQTEIANSVNLFLQQILGQADPVTNPEGQNLTLMEAVDLANDIAEESFSDQPEIESAVRYTLGVIDMNLGRLETGISQLGEALEVSLAAYGPGHSQTMEIRSQLGLANIKMGRLDEAQKVLEEGLEYAQNAREEDFPSSAMVLNDLGLVYLNRGEGTMAEKYLKASARQKEIALPPNDPDYLTTLHNISMAMYQQGKMDSATVQAKNALERRRQVRGEFHPDVAQSLNMVAFMLMRSGRFEEAMPYRLDDLALRKELYPNDHPDKARAYHNLAYLYYLTDRPELALAYEDTAVTIWKNTLPAEHPDNLRGTITLARILSELNDYGRESALRDDHLRVFRTVNEPGASELAPYLINASLAHLNNGTLQRAQALADEAAQNFAANFGDDHWQHFIALNLRGFISYKRGDNQTALLLIDQSSNELMNSEDADPGLRQDALKRSMEFYSETGNNEQADRIREYLENSIAEAR